MGRVVACLATGGLAAALLASCANPGQERATALAERARTVLVGMPESILLSCAGVPERRAAQDDAVFYTYADPGVPANVAGPGASIGVGGGSGGVGVGVGLGFPIVGAAGGRGVEATFTIRDGVVQRVVYGAGSWLPDCAAIVNNCVGPSVAAPG